jgi:DNA-binding NtrC family response regulator
MNKPDRRLRVLYGEQNEELVRSQAALLEKAGYVVQAVIGRRGVQDALRQGSFDLVILGGTLTRDDRHHLPYMVKKANAATQVLVMHTDGSRHPYVDQNTDTGATMEEALRKIPALPPKAASAGQGR